MYLKEKQAPFIEHLEELRKRILISIFFVLIFSIISFFFSRKILSFIIDWTNVETAYFFSPTEAFVVNIKVAIFSGVFLAFPIILYQTWAFIGPGLTRKEQQVSIPFLISGIILFLIGLAFAFFILIPLGLKFFFSFGTENIKPIMNINKILEFIFWCAIGSGFLFQLPLIVFFLVKLGIVDAKTLTRHRAEFIVGVLVISAIITPTGDMFTLLLISIPLILLIETGILLARITGGKKK
ncbi:MAG: twin-arginine translocase subunit TatC [candidate division WOR-3 bacterium]|nr:twin-arginine translocase subunit TatC [candidate division WOR-3 bacterium]